MSFLKNIYNAIIFRLKRFNSKSTKNDIEVLYGPFKGMKYISESNGSVLNPKIYGLYEKELHSVIEEVIQKNYKNIVDIGCAEGYYAVGFATRMKNFDCKIFAFDINEAAINNLQKLADKNGMSKEITKGAYCSNETLNSFELNNTFIFCDIEGEEFTLLDPVLSPSLLTYDILVEVHDAGEKSDRIKNVLKERFHKTHKMQIIPFKGRTTEDSQHASRIVGSVVNIESLNEGRTFGLEWMYLLRKNK